MKITFFLFNKILYTKYYEFINKILFWRKNLRLLLKNNAFAK